MRITFGPWGETLAEVAEAARAAEEAGAEAVWVPELHRSATVSAAAVAGATSRVQVGTAIALAFTRSPMVTALEALDLDELSGGRFVLGLGTGVRRLNEDWHGVDWDKPVTMLRETVRNIREFWARCVDGEPIELAGERAPMRIRGYQRPYAPARTEIPVYLASMGPALTRLAGEIGDGWISHELTSPAFLRERILPELGAHGRQVDVVTSACCSVDRDPAVARRRSAGMVGFYATVRTYADFFDFHGLAEDQQKVIDAFRGTTAGELAGHVSDAMVDTLTLSGTRDQVAEQVTAYDGLADTIKLTPPTHGLTPDEIRAAQREVIAVIEELCR